MATRYNGVKRGEDLPHSVQFDAPNKHHNTGQTKHNKYQTKDSTTRTLKKGFCNIPAKGYRCVSECVGSSLPRCRMSYLGTTVSSASAYTIILLSGDHQNPRYLYCRWVNVQENVKRRHGRSTAQGAR